ncbi:hypothetical protein RFI_06577 [Reticulomyxa filosa]|uniref:Uncharacterized protein n=1 Tax=Reticulomyxa filosa TaxID=46433 RepID=X6NW63_RETFI|nr:hypothetical protein RFI_06577 [Reticulomyxa filosa]|eukprot:ETO30545.1 hypothetical protein RFI_06577 [Reticulomyxa filosa]
MLFSCCQLRIFFKDMIWGLQKKKKEYRMTEEKNNEIKQKEKITLLLKLQAKWKTRENQYLGPIEEDWWWRLAARQPFRSEDKDAKESESMQEPRVKTDIRRLVVDQKTHDIQRTWLHLFIDLVFVAVIVKFGNTISSNYIDNVGEGNLAKIFWTLLESILFFVTFAMLWLELTVTLLRPVSSTTCYSLVFGGISVLLHAAYVAQKPIPLPRQHQLYRVRHRGFIFVVALAYLVFFPIPKLPTVEGYFFFFFLFFFLIELDTIIFRVGVVTFVFFFFLFFLKRIGKSS